MNLIKTSINQPISVIVCMILALVAGTVAMTRVPIQMTPTVDDTVIAVTTRWENASPQEIESEIIDAQEEKLQGLSNLRSMVSTSQRGQGLIRLEFATGVDKNAALRQVSDKLREVPSYPVNVKEPVVTASDPESSDFIAWALLMTPDPDFDIQTMQDFLNDRVKPRLERVPGISEVNVLGGRERETQIRFDPARLAQRHVTVPEFVRALQSSNTNASAGALVQGKSDIRVRTVGRFTTPDDVLNTILRQDDAGPVYVRDVATVLETYKEEDGFVRYKGKEVLAMNFQREPGSNLMQVMDLLKVELKNLNTPGGILENEARQLDIEGGLRLVQVYDQTHYVQQAFDLVRGNIVVGGFLATIILLLFLRSFYTVGIIAISMPICVIGAVVSMVALGRSINVISLAGMAFAVGMVVDNGIVVLENIYRHMEMGKTRMQAAYDGAMEVNAAVLASTLTTLLVFIPILLVQETSGQLLRDIALAIITSVGLSYIVAITIIPCGAAYFLRVGSKSGGETRPETGAAAGLFQPLIRLYNWFGRFPQFLYDLNYRMNGSTPLRLVTFAVFAVVTVGGILWTIPPIDYLPTGNRNLTFGLIIPPPGYNLDELKTVGRRVEQNIRPFWTKPDGSTEGELYSVPSDFAPNSPPVTPAPIEHYFLVSRGGLLFHGGISTDEKRVVDQVALFRAVTNPPTVPGCYAFAFQFPLFRLGGSSGSAVKINLVGADLSQIGNSTLALFGALMQEYGPYAVRPDPANFNVPSPELQITPDLDRLSELRLTLADVSMNVQASSDGLIIGDYDLNGDIVDLKLIARDAFGQTDMDHLPDVKMAAPDGGIASLGAVTNFHWVGAPELIKRVNRQRAITLEFTAPANVPLQQAMDGIQNKVNALKAAGAIHPNVDVVLAGSASRLTEVKQALLGDGTLYGTFTSALFLSLVVIYLLMCILFQSWMYPFVIMFSVPLATFGGFMGLALMNYWSRSDRYMPVQNLDVLTILGFIILAGVVVNNAILIVAQTIQFLTAGDEQGRIPTAREAISLSVQTRARPIFMSMLTSVLGMLPLILMPGSGSELYRGLGAVVVGGLFISTIFTLVLVPILLGLIFDLQDKLKIPRILPHVIGIFLLAPFLHGCTLGKSYRQPEADMPAQWHAPLEGGLTADPADPGAWWLQFDDEALNALITGAVAENHDLKIALARVREARARRGLAVSDLFPKLDAAAAYTRNRNSENIDSGIQSGALATRFRTEPIDIYATGFDAAWEIDIFGGKRRAMEAASAELDAAAADLDGVLLSLCAEVAVNYIELRALQARLEIIRATVASQEQSLALTRARFNAGMTDELDMSQADATLQATRSNLPALQEQEQQTLHRLAILLGRQPGMVNDLLQEPRDIPQPTATAAIGVPAEIVRRRPDIRAAERRLAAQTAMLGVVESDLYPKFFIGGTLYLRASQLDEVFQSGSQAYGLGPSVRWNLFSGGKVMAAMRAQSEREQQALFTWQRTVLLALEDVENAIVAYGRENDRMEILQRGLAAAEKSVAIATTQYQRGMSDFNNVLVAQRMQYQFQDQLAMSRARVSMNLIALYKALGGGWTHELLPPMETAPSAPVKKTIETENP